MYLCVRLHKHSLLHFNSVLRHFSFVAKSATKIIKFSSTFELKDSGVNISLARYLNGQPMRKIQERISLVGVFSHHGVM